ncbi:MAG: sulfatase-like hydrolase/transferase [Proteobacteria bacterium]|nr:sulfatase-like hydrolase/transferase [Pseudomonadota bacterium]
MKKLIVTNMAWGSGWAIRAVVSVFVAEAIALIVEGFQLDIGVLETGCAVLMAAFLAGMMGLVVAIPVGLISAYAAASKRVADLVDHQWQGISGALTVKDPDARSSFFIGTVTVVLFLSVGLATAIWPIYELIVQIQTPIYSAILAAFFTLGALLISGLLWPVWQRTGRLLASFIQHPMPPWAVIASIFIVAVLTFVVFILVTWSNFASYLPWRASLVSLGTFVMLIGWAFLRRRIADRPSIRTIGIAVGSAVFLVGMVLAAALPKSMWQAGTLLSESVGPLGLGYSRLETVLDFDGDGHLSWMGGGDCAPFNPKINPGAYDNPGDKIDQDCDGQDSPEIAGCTSGRHDYRSGIPIKAMPVLFVTVDAVSALHMDLHGYSRTTMPSLTKLAAEGAVFNWAFSEGPASRLSFPSMISGRHNSQIRRRLRRRTLEPWTNVRNTMGTVFANAGYQTEAVAPDNYFSKRIRWLYAGFNRVDTSAVKGRAGQFKNGDAVTKAALNRLDSLKKRDKFFLWVHYTDAHYPHHLPKGVKPLFGKAKGDIYDRELLLLDTFLAKLFAGIKERLKGREYLVVLTADHGQAFDKKHKKFHQDHDLSTAVTWVPMIFWSPFSKGKRVDRLASIIDVLPTMMNMVGIKADGIAGDSLLPTILGKDDRDHAIMQQFYLPEYRAVDRDPLVRVAVRYGKYVLHQTRKRNAEYLYDYRSDPLENHNLIGKLPLVAQKLRTYRSSILSWAYESWNRERKYLKK